VLTLLCEESRKSDFEWSDEGGESEAEVTRCRSVNSRENGLKILTEDVVNGLNDVLGKG